MKRSTIQLFIWASVAYAVLLVVVTGALPAASVPSISIAAIPLIVISIVMVLDLMSRSTEGVQEPASALRTGLRESHVRTLTSQISVAADASDSYFDSVIRARLRELLVAKAALETGLRQETIRKLLLDRASSPRILGNERLHELLYGPAPTRGRARIRLIKEAVQLIGAWKS